MKQNSKLNSEYIIRGIAYTTCYAALMLQLVPTEEIIGTNRTLCFMFPRGIILSIINSEAGTRYSYNDNEGDGKLDFINFERNLPKIHESIQHPPTLEDQLIFDGALRCSKIYGRK